MGIERGWPAGISLSFPTITDFVFAGRLYFTISPASTRVYEEPSFIQLILPWHKAVSETNRNTKPVTYLLNIIIWLIEG